VTFLVGQLTHKDWEGFTFYDLIFPLFVFLAGTSIVYSLGRLLEEQGRSAALRRVLKRTALLYLLGVFYYGGIQDGLEQIRWVGVLQRIAISYGAAAGLYLLFRGRFRPLVIVCALILAAYWALLSFVPLPGETGISFAEGKNWANYIDQHYLPGRKWDGQWDPEGLLSSLPAVSTCLLGVFAGMLLRSETTSPGTKGALLLFAGAVLVAAGYFWGLQLPIIKKIWTPSYVLVAGGYSFVLMGLFYLVIDVWQWRGWTAPFVWIGMNALTVYVAANVIDLHDLANRLMGGEITAWLGRWSDLVNAVVSLAIALLFVRFLYRKQVFLRL
jgi:predicted acyltransferase